MRLPLPWDYLLKNWSCTFFPQALSIWICEACWHELCILQKRWFNDRILTIHRAFDQRTIQLKHQCTKRNMKQLLRLKQSLVSDSLSILDGWHLHYVLIITTKIKFWSNNRVKQHMLWNLLNQLKSLMNLYYLTSYRQKQHVG